MNFLGKVFQLKVSFIGVKKTGQRVYGNPQADLKLAELGIAVLSFGVRLTLRV